MFGFLIGVVFALSVSKLVRMRRYYGGGGCGHRRGWRRGGWDRYDDDWRGDNYDDDWRGGPPWMLRRLFQGLRTSPGQERVIQDALKDLKSAGSSLKDEAKKTRGDLADVLRDEDFNVEKLGSLFARHDEVMDDLRKDVTGAVAQVHDALDPEQRDRLARLVERGRAM